MQKLANKVLLGYLTLACIIWGWSCRRPSNIDECQVALSRSDGGIIGTFTHEIYPGYKAARFSASEESTIYFVKEKEDKSLVMRRCIDKGGNKKIFESDEQIQTFDYSPTGDIAFIHKWKLYLVEKEKSEAVEIPFFMDIGYVKWHGDKMICQADLGLLFELDKQGNQSYQWDLKTMAEDYWAYNSVLIVGNRDSITVLRLPDLTYQWSLPVNSYYKDLGNIKYETRHRISVTGKFDSETGLTDVFFSTPDQIYSYNLETQTVASIWQQQECLVVEPGISLSPDGNFVVVTVSTGYQRPLDHKRFGIMLVGMDGEWEVLEPWNRGS